MSLENSLVLGRYRVLWLLDTKKLIKTYIARDEHRDGIGTPVLIKQYNHDLGEKDSPAVAALFEQLTGLTQFRHPGVVSLLDYGTVGQCLVTAYAHLPGVELPQLCEHFNRKEKPFPQHLAVYLVRRLLMTLHDCHVRGAGNFVHGRITLGCIHLSNSGEPQISDFGLASLEDVAAEAESQLGFFQTRMSYAAPELTRGGIPTPAGDTYSLALLLYRLLSGSNPFRGRSIPETLQRVLQLPPAELLMPDWAHCAQGNAILMRALSKDPGARHQTCLELSDALAAIQTGTDESLAKELAALVRNNGNGDWAQIARLTHAVRKSLPPPGVGPSARAAHPSPSESQAPAFVSGLLTDQPRSVSEHTARDQRQKRERRQKLPMLPTVLIPAAAIIFGLFLGRLGGAGANGAASRAVPVAAPPEQLVNGSVSDLRTRLRGCVSSAEPAASTASNVELDFGGPGELSGVRLNPANLVHTRLGACLLEKAWQAKLSAPAAMSLVIPLGAD